MSANPTTPRKPKGASLDSLHRIIRSLNENYSLGMRLPDLTLSPSRQREQSRTEEERRVDSIYKRAHYLHFQNPGVLSTCLGRFHEEADEVLSSWVSKPNADPDTIPSAPHSVRSEERAALQDLLHRLLHEDPGQRRTKRRSEDFSDTTSKRPKSRKENGRDLSKDIDDIPVRSEVAAESNGVPRSSQFPSFSTATSANSSKLSLAQSIFSLPASQSTVQTQLSVKTRESFPVCTHEYQALDQSFTAYDNHISDHELSPTSPSRQALPAPPQAESESTAYSSVPDMAGLETPVGDFSTSLPAEAATLSHRLKNIWPRLPIPGLNQAPLIILWELNRFALHCGVALDQLNLQYGKDDPWHDQKRFRHHISNQQVFIGKGLPPSCDDAAWEAGLGSFQAQGKAVTLTAELSYSTDGDGPLFNVKLHPPKLELGHRLSRRFGADRFMEVIIPSPTSKDIPTVVKYDEQGPERIIKWLAGADSHHYFLGRTWIPFFTCNAKKTLKDLNTPNKARHIMQERVCFFAGDGNGFKRQESINCIPEEKEASCPSIRTKMSRADLLTWSLNIQKNSKQSVAKLFSRLKLSLSRTWSTVTLEPDQIRHFETDVLSINGQVMNDGIGRLSIGLARKVAACLCLEDTPTCFQGRLGSAKGLWIIDTRSASSDDDDWIETYPSQRKWECDFDDAHHRTLEVRNWSKELRPASLNKQFIPIIEARANDIALMRNSLAEHLVCTLRTELDEQTDAMNDSAEFRAWMQRAGFSSSERLTLGYVPFLGGLPDKDEETVPFLLDSGFETTENEYLRDLVYNMRKRQAENLRNKMNIQIPRSVYAYMVVDFTGALEEGEVQLAFSTKFKTENSSETLLDSVDVLVARAPAHFASDIQKVKAVFRPELKHLKDVIVFSSKGSSPLADMLSGGDYDGDQAWVCWDPAIVDNFTGVPVPTMPDLKSQGYLRSLDKSFQQVWDDFGNLNDACAEFIHTSTAFSMQPTMLGICTSYKEKLCYYKNDVEGQQAVVLSTLAGLLVDQSKQGTLFAWEDFDKLRMNFGMPKVLEVPEYNKSDNFSRKRRDHILDHLRFEVADTTIDETLKKFSDSIFVKSVQKWDRDLTRLFNHYDSQRRKSRTIDKLLKQLRNDIRDIEIGWKCTMQANPNDEYGLKVRELHQKWLAIQPPPELLSSHKVSTLIDPWIGDPGLSKWSLLKASAFFMHCSKTAYKAVWVLAGRQLAWMKATKSCETGGISAMAVTAKMWNILRPDARRIAALAIRRKVGRDNESLAAIEEVTEFDEYGSQIDDV